MPKRLFVLCMAAWVLMGTHGAAPAQRLTPIVNPPQGEAVPGGVAGPRPTAGSVVLIDSAEFSHLLDQAPAQRLDAPLATYGFSIRLPHPDGSVAACFVASSPVMEMALDATYPAIRTFIVQSADGTASGRIELSPRGLTGMLRTPGGVWMIDPWRSADSAHVVAYWLRDLPGGGDWTCHVQDSAPAPNDDAPDSPRFGPGGTPVVLKRVRLAMACTGEYGLYQSQIQGHVPNVADPLASIVTVVSRANVVYEQDLAVHFDLVANNDLIIFTDPDTDPYASTCGGSGGTDCSASHLSVNVATLNSIIGSANYDLGHVLTRIFGGVANLSVLCTSNKAAGVSGIPRGGDIDPFSALVAIHEMGHQFGANHTFSGTRGRCAGNVNLSTAYESGSGSSPMAYAGGCPVGDAAPTDNVVQFADPFFNHTSIEAMASLVAGSLCPTAVATGNRSPSVSTAITNASIPPGTPFVLTASATDGDGDAVTYSWEQRDAGVARPLSGVGSIENGLGAIFRAFPPVSGGTRTFPQMGDVRSGVPTPGEQLPSATNSARHFRVIARDNHPGAGGLSISPTVTLTIPMGATPFAVITPTEGRIAFGGGPIDIAWSVGNTDPPPISCANVNLSLSIDDGQTFPFSLGTRANTGTATVMLPSIESSTARVRLDPVGGVFFAISRPFVLARRCVADVDNGLGAGSADGAVTVDDLVFYLGLFEMGDHRADVDDGSGSGVQDGAVTIDDLLFFLVRFEAGC